MRALAVILTAALLSITACEGDDGSEPQAMLTPCEADAQCVVDECDQLVDMYALCTLAPEPGEVCAERSAALLACANTQCGASPAAIREATCDAGGACEMVCEG